jgi:alkylmercury lyase
MPPHAVHVDGKRLWTWCAWDSLFIPAVLDTTARVDSICATTGEPVTATVGPNGVEQVSPAGAVISFLRRQGTFDHNVILSFCHHVLFFSSAEAGEQWIAGRPDAFLLSLEQAFELGRRVFQQTLAGALAVERAA